MKHPPVDLRPPVAGMIARPVPGLPEDDDGGRYCFEPKLDGWRCLATGGSDTPAPAPVAPAAAAAPAPLAPAAAPAPSRWTLHGRPR